MFISDGADERFVTVAAWNVHRGTKIEAIADMLSNCGADIVLLNECDIGMARSGNVNTVEEISSRLAMDHAALAVEFQEHGLGNRDEQKLFSGLSNRYGLHGNAVLSRFEISDTARILLSNGNEWQQSEQPRRGGRIALAVETLGTWFVCAHLESRTSAEKRSRQMNRIVVGANKLNADRCVIGGDLNNKTGLEPLFDVAEEAGFGWKDKNRIDGRWKDSRLDWFLCRGVETRNPKTYNCAGISDHDLITLEVKL